MFEVLEHLRHTLYIFLILFFRIILYRKKPCSEFEDHGQVILSTYVKRAINISGVHQKPFPKPRNHDSIT